MEGMRREDRLAHPAAAEPDAVGAPARVLRELMRTPAFRELLKLSLREGPPGSAASLARTLLREDVDLALSVMGSTPLALNRLLEFLLEMAEQLSSFPAPILEDFLRQMAERVDGERASALSAALGEVLDSILWGNPQAVLRLKAALVDVANSGMWAGAEALERLRGPSDGASGPLLELPGMDAEAAAELLNSLARLLGQSLSRRPDFLREVFSHIDREAMRQAADGALGSALEMCMPALAWLPGALLRRYGPKVYVYSFGVCGLLAAPAILRLLRRRGGKKEAGDRS
jgi:hypothetical protein